MAVADSILFNGKSIRDFLGEITKISGRGKPPVNPIGLNIAGRHGKFVGSQTYKPRTIIIEGTVEGTSHSDLLANIDNLKSLFAMDDEPVPTGNESIVDGVKYGKLEFGDETDRYYNAIFDGIFEIPDISHGWMRNDMKKIRIRLRCDDPFAYATAFSEATIGSAADTFKVFDQGSAFNESIIEIL